MHVLNAWSNIAVYLAAKIGDLKTVQRVNMQNLIFISAGYLLY